MIAAIGVIAGTTRFIERFSNASKYGLALSGMTSGLAVLGTEILKKDNEDIFTRTLRTTAGFAVGSLIISPLLSKGLKDRAFISFPSSVQFTICGIFANVLFGAGLSLLKRPNDQPHPPEEEPEEEFDREAVLASILSKDVESLNDAPEAAKRDKEIVSRAVEKCGLNIKHASDDLKDDDDIAEKAFAQNPAAFSFFSPRIRKDKAWCIRACQGCYLNFLDGVDDSLKGDEDVVRAAIQNRPTVIRAASDVIKNNKDLLINLLAGYGVSIFINGASDELKEDKEFILRAIGICSKVFEHISETLKEDQDIIEARNIRRQQEIAWGIY